jgi:hypothetical protein
MGKHQPGEFSQRCCLQASGKHNQSTKVLPLNCTQLGKFREDLSPIELFIVNPELDQGSAPVEARDAVAAVTIAGVSTWMGAGDGRECQRP